MRPEDRDPAHLWDMADAARNIVRFTSGADESRYLADENIMMRRAVERELGILGEAAGRVSTTFQDDHPEVPWRGIIAQRNVLAHEYGEIQHELIWRLVADLERLVESETGSG